MLRLHVIVCGMPCDLRCHVRGSTKAVSSVCENNSEDWSVFSSDRSEAQVVGLTSDVGTLNLYQDVQQELQMTVMLMLIRLILLTVVVIFRILIVAIVGETVYEDEQTMFMCNTLQPGCNQACYDKAFPISHIRYWVFQIILVCTPSLCFITYSVHQSAKQRDRRYSFLYPLLEKDCNRENKKVKNINRTISHNQESSSREEPECFEVKELPNTPTKTIKTAKFKRQEGISRFYIIQVVFRNALEIGFLVGQYFLYGFNVPAIFECDRYPCLKEVECYVSRPTEKTVFLVFMFAVSGVCVLLNLAELNHLGWRKIKTAIRGVQARRKSLCDLRKKDLASLTQVPNLGRTQSSESAYV
ncbi:gap junction delta-2 protein-like [Protopterus annectens]|uniref:gap junction delta-2 protein-like n=1 Tax=Protopterus annectens TaxID=7888 RepID=UPI001CFA4DCA|nr:gap junction delta-2 protein-like [Protopterus annectens]